MNILCDDRAATEKHPHKKGEIMAIIARFSERYNKEHPAASLISYPVYSLKIMH